MFCNFCEKFENSKWPPFLVRQNFFEHWHGKRLPIKNFVEIALFGRVFGILKKFENSKWPPYTLWVKNFVEIAVSSFSRYKHFYVLVENSVFEI